MKKNILLLFMSLSLLVGCNDNFDADEAGLNLEVIPGAYVAFNPDGAINTFNIEVTFDPKPTADNKTEIGIEIPNNVNAFDNTTVTYTLGGTAVYGVDYTIDGATSTGGSFIIKHRQGTTADDNLADFEELILTELASRTVDRVLEITLTSVSSPDGEISLGRPGPFPLTTAFITLK